MILHWMHVEFSQVPPYTFSRRRGQSQRATQVCGYCVDNEQCLIPIVNYTEDLIVKGCVGVCVISSTEPVNRATAAREFRVFHTALHSLNSAYRDSVSRFPQILDQLQVFCPDISFWFFY